MVNRTKGEDLKMKGSFDLSCDGLMGFDKVGRPGGLYI